MPQGYKMKISQIRAICSELLREIPQRKISIERQVSRSTLVKLKNILKDHGVDFIALNGLEDQDLAKIIYGDNARIVPSGRKSERVFVGKDYKGRIDESKFYKADFDTMVRRFSDNRNITKKDLYLDYVQAAEAAGQPYMKRTSFMERLNAKIKEHKGPDVYMHREHPFGEAIQIDWCGDRYPILIDDDGNTKDYYVMVMAWPASYYTYARFVPDLTTRSACEALREALIYFGCKPSCFVVDNARCLVTKHGLGMEAVFNGSFEYFTRRCGIQLDANNPYSPNEKSCVETQCGLIQRRCLTRMSGGGPRTLYEANRELMEKVNRYINDDPDFRGGASDTRTALFMNKEKPAAIAITNPSSIPPYIDHSESLFVGRDYYVQIDKAWYSVPYRYSGTIVEADISGNTVIIFQNHKEIARHPLKEAGGYSTNDEHMPEHHRVVKTRELKYKCPDEIYAEAASISKEMLSFCKVLLEHGSFQDRKKGCIYVINYYKRNRTELALINESISSLLHSGIAPEKINSYLFKETLKEFKEYVLSHNGEFPHQTELNEPPVPQPSDDGGAFLRGNDDLLRSVLGTGKDRNTQDDKD